MGGPAQAVVRDTVTAVTSSAINLSGASCRERLQYLRHSVTYSLPLPVSGLPA